MKQRQARPPGPAHSALPHFLWHPLLLHHVTQCGPGPEDTRRLFQAEDRPCPYLCGLANLPSLPGLQREESGAASQHGQD